MITRLVAIFSSVVVIALIQLAIVTNNGMATSGKAMLSVVLWLVVCAVALFIDQGNKWS